MEQKSEPKVSTLPPQMASFNWNDMIVSSAAGPDEHWVGGEIVEDMDLEPVQLVPAGTTQGPTQNADVATPPSNSGKAKKA
jgi:hypothetical protein